MFMIEGVLDGCTYPLSSLSIPYYIKELGCYYDVSVQTVYLFLNHSFVVRRNAIQVSISNL